MSQFEPPASDPEQDGAPPTGLQPSSGGSPLDRVEAGPSGPHTNRVVCWLAILLAVAFAIAIQVSVTLDSLTAEGSVEYTADEEDTTIAMLELQAKIMYFGQQSAATDGGVAATAQMRPQLVESINIYAITPALAQRLAALNAVMLFPQSQEGVSPRTEANSRALSLLDDNPPPEDDPALLRIDSLLRSAILADAPLDDITSRELEAELGWFGKVLAIRNLPSESSERGEVYNAAMLLGVVTVTFAIAVALAICAGVVLLIVGLILLAQGQLRPRGRRPQDRGGICLEMFALYLGVSYLLIQGGTLLAGSYGVDIGGYATLGLLAVSVLAVFWPVLRGAPREVLSTDIGLNRGRGLIAEVFFGIVGYLAGLPIVVLGIITTLGLTAVAGMLQAGGEAAPPPLISHPVITWIAQGGLATKLAVLAFGAAFAPLVEEILFRGAFLGHLRSKMPFLPAAIIVAFVFAIIHPQGLLAVPVLMSLAFSFALIREWRGSLVGPIVAHALNNGTVLGLLILAFS